MARAPKSVEVYKAYNNVKSCLRNHQGPLPAVPLHLRNAPTKLMKNLGYAKGYKYNPGYSGPVEQDYLPEELRGVSFFTWTPPNLWLIVCLSVWINKYAFAYIIELYVKHEDRSNNWFPFLSQVIKKWINSNNVIWLYSQMHARGWDCYYLAGNNY